MNVIFATVAATTFIQAGYFLWKVAAIRRVSLPQSGLAQLLRDGVWLSGSVSTAFGWLFFVWATALGDISFVQPLMSAGDFVLVLLAVVFLKERLGPFECLGIALTLLGAVALSWDASASSGSAFDPQYLNVFVAGLGFAAAALWFLQRRAITRELALALVTGMAFGGGSVITKVMTSVAPPLNSASAWAQLSIPLLAAVIATNTVGLVLLQIAFERGRAAVIVPLQLAAANAVAVTAGKLIFGEAIAVVRGGAIFVILVGTVLMQFKRSQAASSLSVASQ